MNKKEILCRQFDLQAKRFSNWSVTGNIKFMSRYFEFCGIRENDILLDVACGTGDYAIYCAQRINSVYGIDLSVKMIDIARDHSEALQLKNISFEVQDVVKLPFRHNQFTIVNCKSSFHHFEDYVANINEMKRCCDVGGRIAVQDIIAYENPKINAYFEKLEKEIDTSHNITLSSNFINRLFYDNSITILNQHMASVWLNLGEYINHAIQMEQSREKIIDLIKVGINDSGIKEYFSEKGGVWYFKRNVLLILGRKK